ncbi:MAG: amino acid adenylation domain-containing protein, partial [bacterium]|nr:amino acid adenylation domain-containing protein [bacterium]
RGFRIELGEIESRLLVHEEIKEAVVTIREEKSGDRHLCAYFTAGAGEIPVDRLRDMLSLYLPHYMVPSYFIQLGKMPVTPSGKVDRKALPEPSAVTGITGEYTAPSNEIEEKLAVLWASVLDVHEAIGIDDNFFKIGGHSLKAAALIAKIHEALDVKIPLPELFRTPTIRGLAEFIISAAPDKYASIQPLEKKEYYPLSSAQKRLYFLQRFAPGGTAYNMPSLLSLGKDVDKEKLESLLTQLIARHESLRTSFHMLGEESVQRIHEPGIRDQGLGIRVGAGAPRPGEFIRPFDLSRAPLMRVELVRLEDGNHVLLVDMHHIVNDGVSSGILIREFMKLYRGEVLPELRLQYKDYAVWQNREKEKEYVKKQEDYWLERFAGDIPVLDLPIDFNRPAVQSFEGSTTGFTISPEEVRTLETMVSNEDATMFMVLLTVYHVFLSKISGREDIVIGTPVAGRRHADLQPVMGMFVNTLALRNVLPATATFKEFLRSVKERTLHDFENQDYQFEDLVERVVEERDLGRNPLFDVLLVMENPDDFKFHIPGQIESEPGDLPEIPRDYDNKIAKFDLSLKYQELDGRLQFAFEYCTRLFKAGTIERFIAYFKNTVAAITAGDGKLVEIDVLPEAEKHRLLFEFNDTDADFPRAKTIHQLFEEQAARTPHHIALIDYRSYKTHMTYDQLNRSSDQAASFLQKEGVAPGGIVGLMLERSLEMMVGIFGILKAGAAYLPIDPNYPQERIDFMVADSNANCIVTPTHPALRAPLSRGDSDWESAQASFKSPLERGTPKGGGVSIVYVIYTSGSTGRPKGVMIEHRSLVNRLNWMQRAYPIGPGDVILQKTTTTFDVSVWELFWWSFQGASLCLLGPGEEKDPAAIIRAIDTYNVSTMHFVPSMLNVFLEYLEGMADSCSLASLRQVFASGEALGIHHVTAFNRLISRKNGARLINLYGPTEAAIDVSYFNCPTGEDIGDIVIPIGKPIDNIRLYILDKHMQLLPPGVPGELCIAGVGLARGYLNRPELTGEKFNKSYRTYKTGDLARWLPPAGGPSKGNIEYLGRIDHQVKVRGFRIELGEIESRLLAHEAIKEAVVTVREEKSGDRYLCAYFTAGAGEIPVDQLRDMLSQYLPHYMVPSYFIQLEKMPVTPSGKVDRKALPRPAAIAAGNGEYVPPSNEIEGKLAAIWQRLLEIEKIGIRDRFFSIGGDSLRSIRMISVINKELNVNLEIIDLYQNETIEKLARKIEQVGDASIDSSLAEVHEYIETLKARLLSEHKGRPDFENIEDFYPMAEIEKGMVFDYLNYIDASVYHDQFGLQFKYENFDKQRFTKVLELMAEKHDILRTSFNIDDFGEGIHFVHKSVNFDVEYFYLSARN